MSIIQANSNSGLSRREVTQRTRAVRDAELEIFYHGLDTAVRVEMETRECQAVADVVDIALSEELELLRNGLHKAGNNAAALELVARKVNLQSDINNSRIVREFGR